MKNIINNLSYEAPLCKMYSKIEGNIICSSPEREVVFGEETQNVLW